MSIELESANFDTEVKQSDSPVVIDFGATWCGPCKMLEPSIKKLAESYAGKAKVFSMDVDKARDIASKFGIRGVPTVIFFKNGEEKDRTVGVVPYEQLCKKLDTLI